MHKNVFTSESAAMLLIDHQVGTIAWTHSHNQTEIKKNALQLAKIATAIDRTTPRGQALAKLLGLGG